MTSQARHLGHEIANVVMRNDVVDVREICMRFARLASKQHEVAIWAGQAGVTHLVSRANTRTGRWAGWSDSLGVEGKQGLTWC